MVIAKSTANLMMALAVMGIFPISAGAADCGYGHCFGALGLTNNGLPVYTTDLQTTAQATQRIDEICGKEGCSSIEVFANGCAAMVSQTQGKFFYGFAETKELGQAEALDLCTQAGSSRCFVVAWACTR